MKICVVSTGIFPVGKNGNPVGTSGYAGLEVIAWQCARGLAELGHQVALICPEGSECPGVQIIGIPYVNGNQRMGEEQAYGGIKGTSWGGYWQQLLNFDVIIDHSWEARSALLKMEIRNGRPVLDKPILKVMHAPIAASYKEIPPPGVLSFVCISDDQANHFRCQFNGRDVRVCKNGIDTSFYSPLNPPRTDRFLFLARFSFIKGPHIAIESCRKIGAGLDLIGDTQITSEPDYIRQCIAMADGKQIRIVGNQPRGNCVWWFSQANCMLHPNLHFCHLPSQRVITERGSVKIKDVAASDKVMSHDGKYYAVSQVMRRKYNGQITVIRHSSFSGRVKVTPDHPLYAVRPKICACMGESSGAICKPTYGGYERCKELREITIDKQGKHDSLMELVGSGVSYPKAARQVGIAEQTAYYWSTGRTPRAERDTSLPYCDNYKPEWVAAKDVEVGDLLVTPVPQTVDRETIKIKPMRGFDVVDGVLRKRVNRVCQYPDFPSSLPLSPKLLSLCGWYIAEGYECKGGVRITLNRNETEYANEVRMLGKRLFGFKSSTYLKGAAQEVAIRGKPLGLIMKQWFGNNAREKMMPQWMLLLPKNKLKYVIRSMWKGDGCKVNSGGYESLSYTTASPTLAMQLWLALTKFGILGYLVEKKSSPNSFSAGEPSYNLNVRGDYAIKLAKVIGWTLNDRRRSGGSWKGVSFIHKGMIYSRVGDKLMRKYSGSVYNMTVPGTNSYLAQLIGSHNCEPLGLAPLESQACGCPVVAFDNGAMRETVKDGETGWVCKKMEEFDAVVNNVKTVGIPDNMRKRCREWVCDSFPLSKMILRYQELCQEALDNPW